MMMLRRRHRFKLTKPRFTAVMSLGIGPCTTLYRIGYIWMIELRETGAYRKWFAELKDTRARARVLVRLRRLSLGNPGDVQPVGGGVSEMRIDWGPGYRVYFVARGGQFIVLLGGGTKSTQARDIAAAIVLAREL